MAKLYFFEGRNTGIYAESAKAARAKCKRGCGKLVKTLDKTPPKGGAWIAHVRTERVQPNPQ